ncbi:caspase family protein [Streptomyces spororaveus]|uniref:HD domain-containing protein n=1 Tax=Streptomyces spororaveus TaxID=284039 RepID=UPI00378F3188
MSSCDLRRGYRGGRVAGARRTALLIGVGDIPGAAHRLPPLGATVDADLWAMGAALEGSGYAVETLRDPTRNEITERITALAVGAAPGSTLLLYFTGHGVRIGTTDYLVPADARVCAGAGHERDPWRRPHVRESLLDADISRYLADCGAGTVLWLIDACRSAEDAQATAFGSHVTKGPPHSGFALLTGCAPGERSGFSEAGSFFSLALARAFDPLTEAATVEQVYEAVRRETRARARYAGAAPQQVLIRYGSDREAETRSQEIARGRRLLEAWQDAVRTPALWDRVPAGDPECVAHFQDCLAALALDVARHVHHAQERLHDPWADDEFPVRLLRDVLPMLLPEDAGLSALEVTVLIGGVLLHEAAWADRLSQAAEIRPRSVRRSPDADDQRRHYEQIAEHHPQIAEKLKGRYERESALSDDLDSVVLWLVHRWIGERFATDEEAVPAVWGTDFVARLLEGTPPSAGKAGAPGNATTAGTGRAAQLSAALRTVAAGLVLGEPPEARRTALPARHVVRGTRTPQRLRVRPLAALLRLAGLLALDARRLPEVVAEHLAVSDPVVPHETIAVLRDAVWDLARSVEAPPYLHLDAVCPHPAIHAALASAVEDADELVQALTETAQRLPSDESALLKGLPARLTDHRLRAQEQHGLPVYDVPLARFSLAQTEIRRLLMGEELYDGKPALALREMYQNALDACRYREMRVRYLRGCGKAPRPWAGGIRIGTGEDERGRYVECLDNGVGMTEVQLRNTFTRAGRRFDQSQAFRREQAAWLRQDRTLRLHPNSRFGIGVFSYFMLADEMVIVTRPVGTDGRPAQKALRVEIPVSGNLFRVREADERDGTDLPDGGTRVRLYLRDARALTDASCLSALRSQVLVSEFALEVKGADGRGATWAPGELQSGEGKFEVAADSAVEAVPGTLWWVEDDGALVCDGIVTDKSTFGYVLNLSGAHRGRLSVNRNKLEGYDFLWSHEQMRRGASALAAWPGLSLDWLRSLESRHPSIARILWRQWRGRGVRVAAEYGRTVDLDEVGWFRLDSHLGGRSRVVGWDGRVLDAVRPWRTAALGRGSRGQGATPGSLEGHPVPQPGWSDIATGVEGDWRHAVRAAQNQGIRLSEVLLAARSMRIAHPRLAGPAVFGRGDLDWVPDATDLRIVSGLLGPDRDAVRDFPVTVRGRRATASKAPDTILYRHPPEDLGGIVRASAECRTELGRLAEACAKYAPFLPEPVPAVPGHHRDHVCTRHELALLYVRKDQFTWRPVTTARDLRVAAVHTGGDPREALRRIAPFGWLRPVPDPAAVDRWARVPADLFPLLWRYVFDGDDGRTVLPWAATIDLAAAWEIPLGRAERFLAAQAEALGLAHQRRYTKGSAGRRTVPSPETGQLVGRLHGVGVRLEGGVSLRDLAYVRPHETSLEEQSWSVDELRAAGVSLPDCANLLRAWDELPTPSRYAFSGVDPSFDAADYPVPATPAVLFTASVQLREKLSYLWKTANREAERLKLVPELTAGELPKELRKFRPSREEEAALVAYGFDDETEDEWCESPVWTPLTLHGLVGYARERRTGVREAFKALAPLRAIGALVPELDAETVAALPDGVPDALDVAAVDPEHRVSPAGSPLVPLDLVSIAGRLGEPVSRTWRRIRPYLAFEGGAPPVTGVPDTVPRWQDLALLSERLDGMLPAVGRTVDRERVAARARAAGEPPSWVRERLAVYAEMFGLEVEPAEEDEEAP